MIFREYSLEVGEMVQWLESLAAFPDDLSSILSTHISPQMPMTPSPRDPVFSSDLHGTQVHVCKHTTHTHMHAHTHMNKIKFSTKKKFLI